MQDIMDPEKGHIKDDAIILEVWVSADAPHGVRYYFKFTPKEFQLKILNELYIGYIYLILLLKKNNNILVIN